MAHVTVPPGLSPEGLPTATVVVPCCEGGACLDRLVDGALSEPGLDVRMTIVDDAAPDGSGEIAERLAGEDDRVSVIHHAVPTGRVQACNDALARVRTDYVMLLQADQAVPTDDLRRAVWLMQDRPRVGLVYRGARSVRSAPAVPLRRAGSWTTWSGGEWIRLTARQGGSLVGSGQVILRTTAMRSVGLLDHRLPLSGPLDLWLRTALFWDVARINRPSDAGPGHDHADVDRLNELRQRRAAFEIFFDEHAAHRPDIRPLRRVAMHALAQEVLSRALAPRSHGVSPTEVEELVLLAGELDPSVLRTARRLRRIGLSTRRGSEVPASARSS